MDLLPYSVEQVLPDGSIILVARNHAASGRAAIEDAQLPPDETYRSYVKNFDHRTVKLAIKHERFAVAIVASIKAKDKDEAYKLIERLTQRGREINVEYSTHAFPVPTDHHTDKTAWWIPEVLWGDGNINVLSSVYRTIRGDIG